MQLWFPYAFNSGRVWQKEHREQFPIPFPLQNLLISFLPALQLDVKRTIWKGLKNPHLLYLWPTLTSYVYSIFSKLNFRAKGGILSKNHFLLVFQNLFEKIRQQMLLMQQSSRVSIPKYILFVVWEKVRHLGKRMSQIPFCDAICGSEVKRVRVAFPPDSSGRIPTYGAMSPPPLGCSEWGGRGLLPLRWKYVPMSQPLIQIYHSMI